MPFEAHDFTVGRYRARYLLGRGGMSTVYLAQTIGPGGFERWVAMKVIPEHAARDERFITMFLDEARLSARLYHQNVCTVFDHGEADGTHFIAMEYLHGEPFNAVIRKGIPTELAARVVRDAARGLHAAHDLRDADGELLGLVHRDVSPQNIMVLYDGHAKVLDFGIARARERLAETTTGSLKGKLAYMSPEQLEGEAVDRRTDVFALGIVAWESALGWRLFKRGSAAATMRAVLTGDIPSPTKVSEGFPAPLEGVIMRALERDRERRWQDMESFADALDEALFDIGRTSGGARLSHWMKEAFAERRTERDAMLRAPADAATGTGSASVEKPGSGPPDVDVEVDLADDPTELSSPPAVHRRRWAALVVAASVGVFLVIAMATAWIARGGLSPARAGSSADALTVAVALGSGTDAAEGPAGLDAGGGSAGDGAAAAPPPVGGDAGGAATLSEDAAAATPPRRGPRRPPRTAPAVGFVNVVAVPAAQVWLGSRRLGTTPVIRARIRPGRHVLRLRAVDGSSERRATVEVRAGEVSRVAVRFDG